MAKEPRPEMRKVYVYLCERTCWRQGKRWYAGTQYKFNQELTGNMAADFQPIREEREAIMPGDGLAYDVIGREKKRPSEYQKEL
jgi:hypothetical protein